MPAATTRRRAGTRSTTQRKKKSTQSGATQRLKTATVIVEDLADFNESINLLVYGDSGVGKTPFAGGAPRAVFVSTEKGTISAKRFGSTAKLIRATDWPKLVAALEYLRDHKDDFDWVILDSITKMQVLLMRFLLEINVEEERKNADLDLPQIQDHQKWQNMFKRFVDEFVDLEIDTIFVATAMHKEDAEGEDLILPDIHGKDYAIAQYVCAQMDAVYCLKVASDKKSGQPVWKLLTKTRPPHFAKDRYNALPTVVMRPEIGSIIDTIKGSIESGEASPKSKPVDPVEPEDIDDADDEPDEDWDDLNEEGAESLAREAESDAKRSTRRPAPRKTRRPAKAVSDDESDEDEPEDNGEDSQEVHNRSVSARKRPAKRTTKRTTTRPTRRTKKPPAEEPDEIDEFDPDDEEE